MPDKIVCSDPTQVSGNPVLDAYGMVLVVGDEPARSKTLLRLLATLSGEFHAILLDPAGSLADPVVAEHAWFHAKLPDMTRAQGLRAALRQDPDVIVVDRLAEKEELEVAIQASLTGHLVFAGMEAPSLAAALEKLKGQVDAFLVDSAGPRFVAASSDARFAVGPPRPPRPEPTLQERYALGDRERARRERPLLETLRAALEPHRRDAFRPELAPPGDDGQDSKYGGRPWLRPGEQRPALDGAPLFLALQLDLASLPKAAQGALGEGGHLQVFRAVEADDDGSPFSRATVARVLPALSTVALAPEVQIPGASWKPRAIAGWTAFDDFPHREDWRELGVALSDDDRIGMDLVQRFSDEHVAAIERGDELGKTLVEVVRKDWDHYALTPQTLRQARRYRSAAPGDKLLGWPAWEQGPEWPSHGGARMRYLLQVEFDEGHGAALPSLVASDGRMHLFRSEKEAEIYAAPWACG